MLNTTTTWTITYYNTTAYNPQLPSARGSHHPPPYMGAPIILYIRMEPKRNVYPLGNTAPKSKPVPNCLVVNKEFLK
jgi:hypothetical protein